MDIEKARVLKEELEKNISELLKDYEKQTNLQVSAIYLVRQSLFNSLGIEVDSNYAVESEIKL